MLPLPESEIALLVFLCGVHKAELGVTTLAGTIVGYPTSWSGSPPTLHLRGRNGAEHVISGTAIVALSYPSLVTA